MPSKNARTTKPVKVKKEGGDETKVEKKKPRAKAGSRANRQITEWQNGKKCPIAYAAFKRCVQKMVQDWREHQMARGVEDVPNFKLSKDMLKALRDRVVDATVDDCRRARVLTVHGKRETTYVKDWNLALALKDNHEFRPSMVYSAPPGTPAQ